ncbi:MAG: hypothetical protein ABH914_00970 [Candidatus Omnitrophota bacterium]
MAEKRPITPERELLRLIEDPDAKGNIPKTKATRQFAGLFSLAALKSRFSFFKANFKGGFSLQKFTDLEFRGINRLLEFCIFILLFYLAGNFITSVVNLNKKSSFELEIKKNPVSSEIPEVSFLNAASYYLEKTKSRDIFKMGLSDVVQAEQVEDLAAVEIVQAAQKLKIVGISWSQDPDVIIEDTQLGKAYFLKKGKMINDFKVKSIFKDKVILEYKGKEFELK